MKKTRIDRTWEYVLRSDDMRNQKLWRSSPELMKIYQLFVVEGYSTSQTARMMEMNPYYVMKLIEQIRSQYKIGLIGRLMRKWRIRRLELKLWKQERGLL